MSGRCRKPAGRCPDSRRCASPRASRSTWEISSSAIRRPTSTNTSTTSTAQYTHPFFVLLTDGRVVTSGSTSFPEPLLRMAREQLDRRLERPERTERGERWRFERPDRAESARPDGPRADAPHPDDPRRDGALRGRGDAGDRGRLVPRGGERFDRPAGAPGFARPVPILANGKLAGLVIVPPQAPFGFLLGRFAPMLALVAGGVMVLGTVVTSLMIFGPARRRLRELEAAAHRLGAGDLTARAPARGGDEVAAVASAFNAMAADLATRAEALAVSDRTRRQLLADVSHELTTPVTAIRGYLETLSMPELTLDAATRARYLSIISDETHRLERLIGDLLELARLEGGGGSLTMEPVGVAAHLSAASARGTSPRAARRACRWQRRSIRAPRPSSPIATASNKRSRTWPRTRSATRRGTASCASGSIIGIRNRAVG